MVYDNYEDNELNTIKTASKNINITNKKIINNKIKAKAPIKNTVTEFKDFKFNKKKQIDLTITKIAIINNIIII